MSKSVPGYTSIKTLILFVVSIIPVIVAQSQNIFTALHLNEDQEYKTEKPASITEINTFFTSEGKKVEKNVKTFNNAGKLVLEERFENEKLTERLTYGVDSSDQRVQSRMLEMWLPRGYSKQIANYTYDIRGYLIAITDQTPEGVVTGRTSIVPDENGRPIEMIVTDAEGNLFGIETATYLYDQNLAITSVMSNEGEKLTSDTIKISFIDAHKYPRPGEIYNEHGDLVRSARRTQSGALTTYEYEYLYDTHGNCVEQKIFKVTTKKNGKEKRTVDRIFTKEYVYK